MKANGFEKGLKVFLFYGFNVGDGAAVWMKKTKVGNVRF